MRNFWLALAVLQLGLAGCMAGDEGDDLSSVEQAYNWPQNGLLPDDLLNCLIANAANNEKISGHSLEWLAADPGIQDCMLDARAQHVFAYMVSAALGADQSVTVNGVVYHGTGLALCSSWQSAPPPQSCLRAISADVLARVNVLGVSIDLAQGGLDGNGMPLPRSAPLRAISEMTPGNPIASYAACPTPTYGPNRNCGWPVPSAAQPQWGYVSTCSPGTQVTVSAAGHFQGWSTGDHVMRVCAGATGCNDGTTYPWLAANDDAWTQQTPYNMYAPEVTFTCPQPPSGYTSQRGIFTVMFARYASNDTSSQTLAVGASLTSSTFPGNEIGTANQGIYHWKEGAFFGSFFEGLNVNVTGNDVSAPRSVTVTNPAAVDVVCNYSRFPMVCHPTALHPFKAQYVCSSDGWTDPDARTKQRLCGGTSGVVDPNTGQIIPTVCGDTAYLGRCNGTFGNSTMKVCSTFVVGDETWDQCRSTADVPPASVYHPITTHLKDPCSIPGVSACGNVD